MRSGTISELADKIDYSVNWIEARVAGGRREEKGPNGEGEVGGQRNRRLIKFSVSVSRFDLPSSPSLRSNRIADRSACSGEGKKEKKKEDRVEINADRSFVRSAPGESLAD